MNPIKRSIPLLAFFVTQMLLAQVAPVTSDVLQTDRMIGTPSLPQESVATADDTTSLYYNPAGLGYHALQLGYFYGSDRSASLHDHTMFLNLLGIAFSTQWRLGQSNEYARRHSLGFSLLNTPTFSMGTSYSWYNSSLPYLDSYNQWDLGFLFRPWRRLSFGGVGRALNQPLFRGAIWETNWDLGVGFRPLPSKYAEWLTLAVDTNVNGHSTFGNLIPRYFLETSFWPGAVVYGGYNQTSSVFFGLRFSQHISQMSLQASTPSDRPAQFSGGILIGRERYKTGIEAIGKFVEIKLDTPWPEKKKEGFLIFAENFTFFELLRTIELAKQDSQVKGIFITGHHFGGGWGKPKSYAQPSSVFKKKNQSTHLLKKREIKNTILRVAPSVSICPLVPKLIFRA